MRLRTSDDRDVSIRLEPVSVADFYGSVRDLLSDAAIDVRIWPVPVEVEDAIPFESDTAPGGYDPAHARALHGALIDAHRVLTRFRGGYTGKASPVHFFWGGFDLATTRFSGRPAPRHPGGAPNCPAWVMEEAYSHEVSSAGWWPGSGDVGPSFYSYMYPEPAGYRNASLGPVPGAYHQLLGDFLLPYDEVGADGRPGCDAARVPRGDLHDGLPARQLGPGGRDGARSRLTLDCGSPPSDVDRSHRRDLALTARTAPVRAPVHRSGPRSLPGIADPGRRYGSARRRHPRILGPGNHPVLGVCRGKHL